MHYDWLKISYVDIQEVDRVREKIRTQSSNTTDMQKQMETAENAMRHTKQQHRQCADAVERLEQRLSAAEAKLEQLAAERHRLLVYAVVVSTHCATLIFLLIIIIIISVATSGQWVGAAAPPTGPGLDPTIRADLMSIVNT